LEIDELLQEAANFIGQIDECIKKAWHEVKIEPMRVLLWDERELIMPFYFHLRPMIEDLNENLKDIQFYIIPEYAPKASSYAKKYDEGKYPPLLEDETERSRTRKVDLCIAAFDSYDLENKKKDTKRTYWFIKHLPIALLEFKIEGAERLYEKMKNDLEKCREIKQKYLGVNKIYLCCLTNKGLSKKRCQKIMNEAKVENFTVCYGTWDGNNWDIVEIKDI
jgi:hypothetical protein